MAIVGDAAHLFISYSRRDFDTVSDIAHRLRRKGVNLFFDAAADDLTGKSFLDVIEQALRRAETVAVFVGPSGLGDIQALEVNLAVIHAAKRGLRVVPVLLPGVPRFPELKLFLQCFSWFDLRKGVKDEEIDRLARLCKPEAPSPRAFTDRAETDHLPSLLQRAQRRLIISGHTLARFTRDTEVQQALLSMLTRGVHITILQLNPDSPYADAHRPFHDLESTSTADDQYEHTLDFLSGVFNDSSHDRRQLLDVSFANYMPRFRTVIVDDEVYVYLYMYGSDVGEHPDLCLTGSDAGDDMVRQRILYSTLSSVHAPESIPFIRCGQLFSQWRAKHICKWSHWSAAERSHHKVTHEFYVNNAEVFHQRFGAQLEAEVRAHLDRTTGSTLVLGCGSGKEVEHIALQRPGEEVIGVDFSHEAIQLARFRCRTLPATQLLLSDFYDLDLDECLGSRVFDSVVANAAFVHLKRRDDIDDLLEKVAKRLRPGGVLFLRCLVKEANGRQLLDEDLPAHRDRWGSARWFVYYSRPDLVRRCEKAGFHVDHKATEFIANERKLQPKIALQKGFPHAEHGDVFWPCILARKRSPAVAPRNAANAGARNKP
jgi:SAM-dependent methyltransferase